MPISNRNFEYDQGKQDGLNGKIHKDGPLAYILGVTPSHTTSFSAYDYNRGYEEGREQWLKMLNRKLDEIPTFYPSGSKQFKYVAI